MEKEIQELISALQGTVLKAKGVQVIAKTKGDEVSYNKLENIIVNCNVDISDLKALLKG